MRGSKALHYTQTFRLRVRTSSGTQLVNPNPSNSQLGPSGLRSPSLHTVCWLGSLRHLQVCCQKFGVNMRDLGEGGEDPSVKHFFLLFFS